MKNVCLHHVTTTVFRRMSACIAPTVQRMVASTALFLVVVSAGLPQAVSAQEMQQAIQQFDAGTVALLEGNFQQAISLFGEAEKAGWASPELYYNTGLAYHRLNKLGMAIVYLERAKELSPDDPKILHGLSVANHKQADRFSILPAPFWKKIHRSVLRVLPITLSYWLGLFFWTALVSLWIGYLLKRWRGDWWRRSRSIVAMLALFFIVHSLASSAWPPFTAQAVIVSTEARLRSEALDESEEVIRVHEGLVVSIQAEALDWMCVEIPNGTKGWVRSTSLVGI